MKNENYASFSKKLGLIQVDAFSTLSRIPLHVTPLKIRFLQLTEPVNISTVRKCTIGLNFVLSSTGTFFIEISCFDYSRRYPKSSRAAAEAAVYSFCAIDFIFPDFMQIFMYRYINLFIICQLGSNQCLPANAYFLDFIEIS